MAQVRRVEAEVDLTCWSGLVLYVIENSTLMRILGIHSFCTGSAWQMHFGTSLAGPLQALVRTKWNEIQFFRKTNGGFTFYEKGDFSSALRSRHSPPAHNNNQPATGSVKCGLIVARARSIPPIHNFPLAMDDAAAAIIAATNSANCCECRE